MLSTIFLLFMSGWMLAIVLEYRMNAIPVVALLTTAIVSIRLIQSQSFASKQASVQFQLSKENVRKENASNEKAASR